VRATRIVVVVLAVDALVLGAVGLQARRPLFLVIAVLSGAAAWAVTRMERGYRARMVEIQAARRALRDEVRAMAAELRPPPGPPAGPP
jgi:hypothetical protein